MTVIAAGPQVVEMFRRRFIHRRMSRPSACLVSSTRRGKVPNVTCNERFNVNYTDALAVVTCTTLDSSRVLSR